MRQVVSTNGPMVLPANSILSSTPSYMQVTLTAPPTCNTASLPRQSERSSFPFGAARLSPSSILATTSAPKDVHHRVGVIVGACLGAAGGVLLIGLGLFWVLLRHRQHTATTAQAQDVVPRSWAPSDFLRGHNVAVVANHPSLSLDLAGADAAGDADKASFVLTSEGTSETKRWNLRSSDVLDISVENAPRSPPPIIMPSSSSPVPEPIEPYVPSPTTPTQARVSNRIPALCIHTDVRAASTTPTPPGSQEEGTSAISSSTTTRSPHTIRPLPTPPTRSQTQTPRTLRRPRSAKADEVHRSRTLPRSAVSAVDLRAYVHGSGGVGVVGVGDDRRSMMRHSHSVSGLTGPAADGDCEIVQHHDGGVSARIDLPPPYYECLRVQPDSAPPSSQPVAWHH